MSVTAVLQNADLFAIIVAQLDSASLAALAVAGVRPARDLLRARKCRCALCVPIEAW